MNSTIASNSARHGSGIELACDCPLEIRDSLIRSNKASGFGAGVRASHGNANLLIVNTEVIDNTAGKNGGGLYIEDAASIELREVSLLSLIHI